MNRIDRVFHQHAKSQTKAFIPYVTAGDPTLEKTAEMLDFLVINGADIIEVGVPFSDPMADGPVIQAAMERSLRRGTTLKKVLDLIRNFRRKHPTPVILMGYCNPFWAYGIDRFARDARDAGVDGVLTVDLPPEEAKEFRKALNMEGIASIFLLTPVSDEGRIAAVKKVAKGFVYFVSVTGVTGERKVLPEEIKEKMLEVRRKIPIPLVLGFGISTPATIDEFHSCADGFVVGSALLKRWEDAQWNEQGSEDFHAFLAGMVSMCHRDRA